MAEPVPNPKEELLALYRHLHIVLPETGALRQPETGQGLAVVGEAYDFVNACGCEISL